MRKGKNLLTTKIAKGGRKEREKHPSELLFFAIFASFLRDLCG
jgi:hypothetical protein